MDKRLVTNQLLADNKDMKTAYDLELKSGVKDGPVAAWLNQLAQQQLDAFTETSKSGTVMRK